MTGRRLGRFEILEQIGEGGMGVVFKARDTHLDRIVALKILPAGKVGDAERRRRFTLEAKAASALNHPGIVTIHDIDSADGELFIAMEFVAGRTLGQWIKSGKRNLRDALRYAVQVAEALTAAHAAGIIHRDLKPGNVMITGEGSASRAKVLDFGLAKLTDASREPTEATLTMPEGEPGTGDGVVVGTTAYMSPEQAEGKAVDARSDVFSFGSVLYEMVTGRRAFHGDTALSTLSSILKDDPKPVSQIAGDTPPEVERVISRCLRKDPAKRFQHMDDLKVALEELLEESNSGTLAAVKPAAPVWKKWLWPALAGLVVVGGGATWYSTRDKAAAPVAKVELRQRQLTFDSGLTTDPTVWPAGRMIAYASDRAGGGLDIWVQHLDTNETRRLTTHEADESEPSFSPDGTRVAYYSSRDGGGVYAVSTLGGEERKIAQLGRGPRYSPDGKWIAYWVGNIQTGLLAGRAELHLVPAAGGDAIRLASDFLTARRPVWSSDSRRLIFRGRKDQEVDWWIASIDGSSIAPVRTVERLAATRLAQPEPAWWDYNGVYFTANSGDARGVWFLPLDPATGTASGGPQPVFMGTGSAGPRAASIFDGQIVHAQVTDNSDIWLLPVDTNAAKVTGALVRVTAEVSDEGNCGITNDGKRLAYVSIRSGQRTIVVHDLTSNVKKSLISAANLATFVRINRDGTLLTYYTQEAQRRTSFVLGVSGGPPRKLCEDCQARGFSRDGGAVLVTRITRTGGYLALIDLETGGEAPLTEPTIRGGGSPQLSFDGKWISLYDQETVLGVTKMWLIPLRAGGPVANSDWIAISDGKTFDVNPEWSQNGRFLYFQSNRDGFRCLWAQRLDPGTGKLSGATFPIQHLHQGQRSPTYIPNGFGSNAVAADKIAFTMAERTGNIWIAELPK